MIEHKISITMRALLQRINRKLAPSKLCATRGTDRYHVINTQRDVVTHAGIDPEIFGREIGVLKGYEEIK